MPSHQDDRGNQRCQVGLTYTFPEAIVGTVELYFISVSGDPYVYVGYVEGVDADGLRRRRIIKAIKPAAIPTKATPPTTPPAIAPTFNFLLVAATEVEVEVEVAGIVELVA